jgi:AcrR family transcriptional regulator
MATGRRSKSRGGRPTKSSAAERDRRLVDVATALFLERGFDATTIDAVAEAARVSKLTLYSQYRDKRGLFAAVLRQEIERWLAPLATAAEMPVTNRSGVSIEKSLVDLGRKLQAVSGEAGAWAVGRILAAQAGNFPELASLANEEGWLKATATTARLFRRLATEGLLEATDAEIAAEAFLHIVLGHNMRCAMYGIPIDPKGQDKRLRLSIRMLLTGLLPKS